MNFYENQVDTLIVGKFMQRENQTKLSNYLGVIARRLNDEMEPFSDEMSEYLETAENKVREQVTAEKFMEEVSF